MCGITFEMGMGQDPNDPNALLKQRIAGTPGNLSSQSSIDLHVWLLNPFENVRLHYIATLRLPQSF